MTDQDLEALTRWLRERMPGYRLQRERRDDAHVFEVRRDAKEGKKQKKRGAEGDGDRALLVLPGRFTDGGEWPSLAELQRALETASVDSLLMKGRRLRVRSGNQEEMRKVWVQDMDSEAP